MITITKKLLIKAPIVEIVPSLKRIIALIQAMLQKDYFVFLGRFNN